MKGGGKNDKNSRFYYKLMITRKVYKISFFLISKLSLLCIYLIIIYYHFYFFDRWIWQSLAKKWILPTLSRRHQKSIHLLSFKANLLLPSHQYNQSQKQLFLIHKKFNPKNNKTLKCNPKKKSELKNKKKFRKNYLLRQKLKKK